jgi:hypothetical protein
LNEKDQFYDARRGYPDERSYYLKDDWSARFQSKQDVIDALDTFIEHERLDDITEIIYCDERSDKARVVWRRSEELL